MKLEQQVVSLELAKRLKELGVKQESMWHWYEPFEIIREPYIAGPNLSLSEGAYRLKYRIASAFTVAELGEILPAFLRESQLMIFKRTDDWEVYYDMYFERGDTEADARGRMLIYLLENKLLK